MKAGFRIEVGKDIGLGHLRRSTALAHEFKRRGLTVNLFVPKNSIPLELKQEVKRDFSLIEYESSFDINIFKGYDYLVTDSYKVTTEYLKKLRRQVGCLISIDDSNRITFPVDYFINGALYANELTYQFENNTKPLLGTKYFLLRRGLRRKNGYYVGDIKKIFMSLGASKSEIIQKILYTIFEELKFFSKNKVKISIVLGPYFKKISQNAFKSENVSLYQDPSFINKLMSSSDVAISAGGQTLYELAFLGIPAVGICIGEDQRFNLEAFSKGGYCFYAGWAQSKKMISGLKRYLDILLADKALRENMHRRQLKLIDGFGPKRVADEILS